MTNASLKAGGSVESISTWDWDIVFSDTSKF